MTLSVTLTINPSVILGGLAWLFGVLVLAAAVWWAWSEPRTAAPWGGGSET